MTFHDQFRGVVLNYPELAADYINRTYREPDVYKTVFPSWDNTARRGPRAVIVVNGTPRNYEFWLKEAIRVTRERQAEQQSFVFINAWNEWAEGCHLEPDRKYGRQFLEATLRVKEGQSAVTSYADVDVPAMDKNKRLTGVNSMSLRFRRMIGSLLRPFPRARGLALKVYTAYFY